MLVLAAGMAALSASAQSGDTYQQWRFDSGANPASPEVSSNAGAGGKASISVNPIATGWQPHWAGLGAATGVWDLSGNGKITLTGPGAAGATAYTFSVQVVQYFDGSIFEAEEPVSVPGATLLTSSEVQGVGGAIGHWRSRQTLWKVPAGGSAPSIVVNGGTATLVDSVAVAKTVASGPPVLVILPLNTGTNAVQISWPSSSSAILESNADLNNLTGWSAVGLTPAVVGNQNVVVIGASGAKSFFRLKLP